MSDLQQRLQSALDDAVARGPAVGLQAAVYLGDALAATAVAGHADEARTRHVTHDTLFNVFSATKAVAAVAVHIQVDRGLLAWDDPVARHWPEFASHGKGATTVRDALLHRNGIPQMPSPLSPEEMCDWEGMVARVADLEPLWEPGTQSGYHAYTYGWITGELVRRSDPAHRPFAQFIRDEITAPLAIDDIWLGISDAAEPRVADIIDLDAINYPDDSPLAAAIPPGLSTDRATFGRPDVRRSCHPGAGGIMNALSLAKFYACLANGGALNGTRIVSQARIEEMRTLVTDETDAVIGVPYRRSLGFWLGGIPNFVLGPNPASFGHPGAGGAIAWCDPDRNLAVAILNNKMVVAMSPEADQHLQIADAIRSAL